MDADWWKYDKLPSGFPYDWSPADKGVSSWDDLDFHLDIGCGTLKKGRLGIDRFVHPDVDLVIDLETLQPMVLPVEQGPIFDRRTEQQYNLQGMRAFRGQGDFRSALPFPTGSIESIVTHHAMEHIDRGFIKLMDECHRVLKMHGVMRIIVPLFPSRTAVEDADHKRYFMAETFGGFCGAANGAHWHEAFSKPYTTCRFEMVDREMTERSEDPSDWWGENDVRELRVTLHKHVEEGV